MEKAALDWQERAEGRPFALGNLTLYPGTFQVTVADERVLFTYQEFELIRGLASVPDKIVPMDVLTDWIWQAKGQAYRRRLSVLVHRIRAKLEGSEPYVLMSVRGRGYGLVDLSALNGASLGSKAD